MIRFFLLIIFFLCAAVPVTASETKTAGTKADETPAAVASEKKLPEWSVLVYMFGQDKTTYKNARSKAALLEQTGSSEKTNILLEIGLDKKRGNIAHYDNDPKTVRRYFLKKATDDEKENSDGLKSVPEYESSGVDMYLMEDLGSFIKWAKEKHPAKHYMLMLWSRYVYTPLRCMNACYAYREDIPAIAVARELKSAGGVDVLAIDSDGLQSADWLYELRGAADYVVGTESNKMVSGYSYSKLFDALNAGGVEPLKAAEAVAYAYVANTDAVNDEMNSEFSSFSSTQGYSQSVVYMAQLPKLKKKADAFVKAIMASAKKEQALEILEKSLYFKDDRPARYDFSPFAVDIYDFATEAEKNFTDKKILSTAKALKEQVNKTVLFNLKKDSENMWNVRENISLSRSAGISVSLPRATRRYYHTSEWNKKGSTWDKFRKWIYSVEDSGSPNNGIPFSHDPCIPNTVTGTPGYYSCGQNACRMDKVYGIGN